ncbi:villin-like protein quail isoform X1 [Bactrocera dorsalis]|uniref:Villin-like protein quail isoform X1 n=1 Tax=Bactrocera dorsalis TaxID=27457 RepID=A0ABM3KA23_BACDO|nr:villin-like protein quail isoform X1 [Bactrocera dorsalis]XP_019845401.2 villin-like protein quail isoform X1 [Bactrocera dorsalis]XP_049318339.1 villin-like protein quail isoform X1 [Bactrocera dorsalis]
MNQRLAMLQFNFIRQEVCSNSISDLKVDASFRKIAKNAICFHIWKIEEDRLEAEPKAQYGNFIDDCAYIIYAAAPKGIYVNQETITRETKPGTYLERFIHFWLGEKVSEQKRSNVAHKIQELDSYFNNVATEYRETQGNESARFLSYFKKGFTILSSSLIASKSSNRLYQLHGRKWLRCIEMDSISWDYFGSDYIMLLKTETNTFVWIGRSSSTAERRSALDWVTKLGMNASNVVIVDDGYEQSLPEKLKNQWNSFLPLSQRVVSQVSATPDRQQNNKIKIYKCGYRGTRLHLDQLDVVIPTKEDLSDTSTAYVLDGCLQGIWLWVGNMAPHQDKISAMGNGRAFVKKKKYPYSTPVIRVVQGHEPVEFIRLFPNWQQDATESIMAIKPVSTIFKRFDALTLSQRPKMAADTQLIDDGTGERKIYHVTKDQIMEKSQSKTVIFITNHCYVVEYTVMLPTASLADAQNVGVSTIIYQWNGSEANADDIANCERFALNTFEKLHKKAMFVQMCEYDETPHFLQIFDGKLIILQSERTLLSHHNNNLNYISNELSLMNRDYFVLRVYGDTSYNAKATEVYPLNTMSGKECYVVKTSHIWVWCGQSSTGDAREMAKNIGSLLGECSLVVEGKEPKEFWRSLTTYMSQPLINGSISSGSSNGSSTSPLNGSFVYNNNNNNVTKLRLQPQLFLAWLQRGKFFMREVIGYEQSDLSPESIYVLDTGLLSYIWLGRQASTYEKDKYMKIAQLYLESVPIARRPTTAVAVIRQDDEPNTFKGLFENWDHNLWNNYVSYELKRQAFMKQGNMPNTNDTITNGINGNGIIPSVLKNHLKDFDLHHKYPIVTLQQETDLLPPEVNPLKREVHLTHDDFVSLFNMSFWEFDELPVWKKQELKKKYKLF